jgi:hypothetical protein
MNAALRPALGQPPLNTAVREVLSACPQARPIASYFDNPIAYAIACERWAIAQELRPALLATAGELA